MKFVEELVVEEFLPTFRSMLAADLRERGLTQQAVADVLGVSQSAVSKYATGEVARNEGVAEDDRVRDLVERVGEGLASGDMSTVQALVEAEVLIRKLEARGDVLARLHEDAVPELAEYEGDFRVHDPDSDLLARERVRSSVRRGVRTLEHASGFATLVPNVGSNLVECLSNAQSVEDVAGVPGRVFDVMGRVEVPGEPAFGVSEHVASVLLAARANGSDASAALNVRYDPALVAALEKTGRVTAEFDADYDDVSVAVADAFADRPDATVLYQSGGFGIEPVLYLLGESAPAVADVARDLLE
ncbi:thiamine-phosphate synthase family protein [Salarchaeum sp. JOR-1]|uniref:thiamine-phosphate synthase family protein n=1 Tax=Salarchaeum sp. JOR-1 TaxID=2599399 RepID=UPI001198785F|nr:thiamine-phosphate synthase family protein [Salarchaeum sp. JOR-1]QDX39810.1 helix-turn-helix domain-containing protein [Salarchaeum sp. JOR-1]